LDRLIIETAVRELYSLLEGVSDERLYQSWCERHAALVCKILGYKRIVSHPSLPIPEGKRLPDLMGERHDSLWEIVELKRPDTPMIRSPDYRPTFYAAFNTYLSQCEEYAEIFEESNVRKWFARHYATKIQRRVPCLIVAGRSEGLDRLHVHDLLERHRNRISHRTYDDLAGFLRREHAEHFGEVEGLSGFTAAIVLARQPRSAGSTFLFDIGTNEATNRASVFIDFCDNLTLCVRDGEGYLHRTRVPLIDQWPVGEWVYLIFELGLSSEFTYLSIELNGQVLRDNYSDPMVVHLPIRPLAWVLGSDVTGRESSAMDVFEVTAFEKILLYEEREQLRAHLLAGTANASSGEVPRVSFRGNQWLATEGHPAHRGLAIANVGTPKPARTRASR
jgi:hypothetical protein